MASSVLVLPATKPILSQTDRIQIVASDLTDAPGRALDGNDDGQPGGDYIGTFSRNGAATDGVPLARTPEQQGTVSAAIGALLACSEFAGLKGGLRARRG
jgi:hypothetical protein